MGRVAGKLPAGRRRGPAASAAPQAARGPAASAAMKLARRQVDAEVAPVMTAALPVISSLMALKESFARDRW